MCDNMIMIKAIPEIVLMLRIDITLFLVSDEKIDRLLELAYQVQQADQTVPE